MFLGEYLPSSQEKFSVQKFATLFTRFPSPDSSDTRAIGLSRKRLAIAFSTFLKLKRTNLKYSTSSRPSRYLQANVLLLLLLQLGLSVRLVLEVDLLPGLQSTSSSLSPLGVMRRLTRPPATASKPRLNLSAQIVKTKQIFCVRAEWGGDSVTEGSRPICSRDKII